VLNRDKVDKVTTSGVFTEYPIPTAGATPFGIAAGPDGNLWFTESNGNKVAKVTTAGVFTEYPIPTAGSLPFQIAAGPDGNLWFTELSSAGKVGRVTTAGVVTEYPLPSARIATVDITAGPDGNMWFTEPRANNVAKVLTGHPANVPKVTRVSPHFGIADCDGIHVRIRGANFTGASSVHFGSKAAVSFRVHSDGVIVAIAPAEPAGTVDVTVTTPNGTSSKSSADQFTYRPRDAQFDGEQVGDC
jgi:sugar lactone lactonase YvrE